MGINVCQHVALRVSDIERSAKFYLEAFDGHYLTLPFVIDDPEMAGLFGGHNDLKVKVSILGFEQGTIELFEFVEPVRPTGPEDPTRSMLMHWCVQVDSVEETLARVEALGAKTVQPLGDWGGSKFVYCYDLDGNVFELLESSMEDIAGLTIDLFPEAQPPAA
jgi:catechol 2,3-dioxygenase-like lactoylglutathione lyase family enzyme